MEVNLQYQVHNKTNIGNEMKKLLLLGLLFSASFLNCSIFISHGSSSIMDTTVVSTSGDGSHVFVSGPGNYYGTGHYNNGNLYYSDWNN